MTRDRDAGVVLINVLVLLGLAASVVYMMLELADLSIARSQRFSEAAQAQALIRAGEQSAIVALRRDMAEAPGIDHPAEPWAAVAQAGIAIEGGGFALEIADVHGLFDLNALAAGGLVARQTLDAIVAKLELDPRVATRIAEAIGRGGPLDRLDELGARAGVAPEDIVRLGTLVTALPVAGDVNVNAAPVDLLAVLLRNPVQARILVANRARRGFLTPDDVAAAGVILPPGVGFTSDLYRTRVTVRTGGTRQSMESLLERRRADGEPEVAVIARRSETAAVSPPPPSL